MRISYGLSKLYYAVLSDNGYGTPKNIPGAVRINLDPVIREIKFTGLDGEEKTPYTIFDGYNGTIEFAGLTEDFMKDILGYTAAEDGTLIEIVPSFVLPKCALIFETSGTVARHKYFYSTFSRPGFSAETTSNSVKIDPVSLSVSIRKHPATKEFKRISSNISAASYKNWFSAVN